MTSLTFDNFPAQIHHVLRRRRTARIVRGAPAAHAAGPGVTRARAVAEPRRQRRRWAALALVAAIAGLHAGAIATFAGARQSARAPLAPVAVTVALARIEPPPPPPPPPPKARLPPPRVKAPASPDATVAAAAAPTPAPAPAPALAPAPAPSPAPAADDKLSEPRGYAGYLRNPAPDYPLTAQRRGLEGQVVLKVHVLASGQPDSVTVARSSGHAILDEAAIRAVVSWAFAPARRGHTPVDGWVQVPLTFKI
jgi:protein TonB